jgi:hypothetical protein
MSSIGRRPVQFLHPLNQKQIDYFRQRGASEGLYRFRDNEVWWLRYFAVPVTMRTPPLDAYEDPGYDVSNTYAYDRFRDEIALTLKSASQSRSVLQSMQENGTLPPTLNKNPYVLPDYFEWWQAENAFRRGFMAEYELRTLAEIKESLKTRFRGAGNKLTTSVMNALVKVNEEDPYVARYFKDLAEGFAQKRPFPFGDLKALLTDLIKKRELAYQQFSPYFYPLRWAPGAGLVGIEKD